MAKNVKDNEPEITERLVNGLIRDVLGEQANLESARGAYMNKARRIREAIGGIFERGASKGIPQKIMKLMIKIENTQAKLAGLVTELDNEERKLLTRIVKAHGNKTQLALFSELPAMPKPTKEEREAAAAAEKEKAEKDEPKTRKPPGVTGDQLNATEPAGNA